MKSQKLSSGSNGTIAVRCIVNAHSGKAWGAIITGNDAKYGWQREWCRKMDVTNSGNKYRDIEIIIHGHEGDLIEVKAMETTGARADMRYYLILADNDDGYIMVDKVEAQKYQLISLQEGANKEVKMKNEPPIQRETREGKVALSYYGDAHSIVTLLAEMGWDNVLDSTNERVEMRRLYAGRTIDDVKILLADVEQLLAANIILDISDVELARLRAMCS